MSLPSGPSHRLGGGILGCATALHLLERGVKDVLLLKRDGSRRPPRRPVVASSAAGGAATCRPGVSRSSARGIWDRLHRLADRGSRPRFGSSATAGSGGRSRPRLGTRPSRSSPRMWPPRKAVATAADVEESRPGSSRLRGVGARCIPMAARCRRRARRRRSPSSSRRPAGRSARAPRSPPWWSRAAAPGRRHVRGHLPAGAVVLAAGAWTNALMRPYRRLGADGAAYRDAHHHRAARRLPDDADARCALVRRPGIREEEGGLLWSAGYGVEPRKIFFDADPFERSTICRSTASSRPGASAPRRFRSAAHAVPQPACRRGRAGLYARSARHRLRRAWGRGAVGHRRRQRGGHHARPGYARLLADLVVEAHVVVRRSLRVLDRALRRGYLPWPSPSPCGPRAPSACSGSASVTVS